MDTAMASTARAQAEEWAAELEALDTSDPGAIRRMVGRVPRWWHTIDLGHGIVTPGKGEALWRLENMRMPDDLRGKTVLDIGAWDGLFSFEAEKRGAARVVAADFAVPQSFQLARKVLGSRVEFVEIDLRRQDGIPADLGTFDVVLFLGVIYHLPDPVGAIKRVGDLTRELMILETDTDWNWEPAPLARLVAGKANRPELTPRDAIDEPGCDWWLPNRACLERLVFAAGFDRYEQVFGPPPAPRDRSTKLLLRHGHRLPGAVRRRLPDTSRYRQSRLIAHCHKSS